MTFDILWKRMVTLKIDEIEVTVPEETKILDAAHRLNEIIISVLAALAVSGFAGKSVV